MSKVLNANESFVGRTIVLLLLTDSWIVSLIKKKAENWISNTWSFIPLFGEICLQYICYFGSISLLLLLRTLEIWEYILNV